MRDPSLGARNWDWDYRIRSYGINKARSITKAWDHDISKASDHGIRTTSLTLAQSQITQRSLHTVH